MHSFIQRLVVVFSAIALATVLVSCGGGGSGGSSGGSGDGTQAQGKGTVGILLTDMPADPAQFAAIIASIIRVELMGSEENGPVTLYSGPAKEFDLLRLRNESIPLAFNDDVPAGTYCKIRLILSDLELVLTDNTPYDLSDNETDHPKLPGNGKLDLIARDCFDVVDGEVLTLQLDIDAGKSIHVIEKGNCSSNVNKSCFNFRPVVFVDVIDKDFDSKLVRLEGEITEIYFDGLLLCDAVPSKDMDNLGCVKIHFGAESAFFDNSPAPNGNDGKPTAISKLLVEANIGEELTVVGWVKSWASIDNDDNYKPEEYYPLLHLEALVAELGNFLQVEGTVAVSAISGKFEMNISSGGPVISDSALAVIIQPDDDDINGTRIVSKSGVLLDPQDVTEPLPVQVDGTLQLLVGIDPLLKAALIIIDKDALGVEQVAGVIQSVGSSTLELTPEADTVCGVAISLLTVDLTSDVKFWTITITNDSYTILPDGILNEQQTVFMNGTCELTGYQTDNVAIIEDERA